MPEERQSRNRDDTVVPTRNPARLQSVKQLPARGLLEKCARPKEAMQYVGALLAPDRVTKRGSDAIRLLERCRSKRAGGTVSDQHVAGLQIEQQPFKSLRFPMESNRAANLVKSIREGVINELRRNLRISACCLRGKISALAQNCFRDSRRLAMSDVLQRTKRLTKSLIASF